MTKTIDSRNLAAGLRLVQAADALLLQGLTDLLPSRAALDAEDRSDLGELLVSLRELTFLLTEVANPAAELPAVNLAWLGLSTTGKDLSDPVSKLIQLGVDPVRAREAA